MLVRVSHEFKNQCKKDVSSLKYGTLHIKEDNKDITESDNLKDFKITASCYVNDKFIGTTVAKKITGNILNDGQYNLEDKNIQVKTGIKIEENVEYQNLDTYIIPKPNSEEVKQKTQFTGYDYMIKFDIPYIDRVTYPIRADDYLEDLCEQVGVVLGSKLFLNNDYMILGNPFTNKENCKVVLNNICQLALGFAVIEEEKLYIRNLDVNGEPVETIDGNNYMDFSPNNMFGPVNSFKIQMKSGVDGEESEREEPEVTDENRCQISISDNYFLNSQEQRELVIDKMFNAIKGLKYLPVKVNYYGYPWLKLGDKIKVLDNNDKEYVTYVMEHVFEYNGSYNGTVKSKAITKTQATYKNTQNIKDWRRKTELAVDKIEGKITQVVQETDKQNQKISQVTQTVNELNSKISDIADITTSKETTNGTVNFEKINQSEPIYVRIYPIGENISYLYPHTNLFPSETLYPKVRTLRFTNTTTKEYFDYELPTDLLYYNAENYDEFILDYDAQSCVVNKRVEYNADGTIYVLENPKTIEYEYPRIELTDGDYEITLLGYKNAYLFIRLMAQNIYTTQFATKAEVNSEIKQTVEEIGLNVDKKLSSYSTTTQMNSAINLKADSITSSVSKTYTTKKELATTKSEIKQTTDNINSEVSKKVGNNEIISKINQSAEEVRNKCKQNRIVCK